MEEYEELLRQLTNFSVMDLIQICRDRLAPEWQRHPYYHPEIINGIGILRSEDAMNAYIAAYGEMHIVKCRAALQNFPFDTLNGGIEIVDWGCGQGIGSLCVIESLAQRDLLQWLRSVTLIEPAPNPLNRAAVNVRKATSGNVSINTINDYLPGDGSQNEVEGLTYRYSNVIHIFSNILDVRSIDLIRLARMVAGLGRNHYVLCMGPMNSYAFRIDQFCNIFGGQDYFSHIEDRQYAHTSDTYHLFTCKTKCFKYNGAELVENIDRNVQPNLVNGRVIYSDYDPNMPVVNGTISSFAMQINEMVVNRITNEDFVIVKPDIQGDTPDFVIVQPNRGIVLLDTFEEDLNDYSFEKTGNKDKNGNDILDYNTLVKDGLAIESPINTMENYHSNLLKIRIAGIADRLITNRRIANIVTKILIFSKNTTEEARSKFRGHSRFSVVFGNDVCTDENIKEQFLKIVRIQNVNPEFDEQTFRNFMRILKPKWHSYQEGIYVNLTRPQMDLSKSSANTRQKISGVAGSGKTQVLVTRAAKAQVRTGGRVLILTYNVALANYVKFRLGAVRADFAWNKIDIDYYHQFFRTKANAYGLRVHFGSYQIENFFDGVRYKIDKYDAIFIDEVQDYDASWLRILYKYFLKDNGEFIVFGDPKQNLYKRPTDDNGDMLIGGVIGGIWNHRLNVGHRYMNPQLELLFSQFKHEFLPSPEDSIPSNVQTELQLNIKYADIGRVTDFEGITRLARYCRNICNRFNIEDKDVVVLSQATDILRDIDYAYRRLTELETSTTFMTYESYNALLEAFDIQDPSYANANYDFKQSKDTADHSHKLNFTMAANGMKFSTIHSFKGWESKTVILLLEPMTSRIEAYSTNDRGNTPELIYTAITRARENLFIINLGNDTYHSFFETNIRN